MSLTGWVFLDLIVACAVASFVALILLWPSLAGRSLGKIAARAGIFLTVNALILLTAVTQLNAQYLFYADWTDLRGAFTGIPTVTPLSRGATASHATRGKVDGTAAIAARRLPPLPIGRMSASGVISYRVKGPLSGLTGAIFVQLPGGYITPGNAAVRYPVIETFSGIPGDPRIWIGKMNLGGVVAQAAAAKRIRPVLIVSPQMEFPAGVDTECVNGTVGNPQVETWLTRDVPNWVADTFRVQTDRTSWAAAGLSAGGWCAAMATMLHPAQYAAAIVMGGYFRPEFSAFYYPYPPRSQLAARYDLVALTKRNPPPVAFWLETSHMEGSAYASSAAFLAAAKPPLAVDATVLQHAGHRDTVWQGLLPTSLIWLGANVRGFKATP